MLKVVAEETARMELGASLDEICREGARRMLAAALEAEADGYIEALTGEVDGDGKRLVVRNGHAIPRMVTTVAGGIEIRAPRVNDGRVDPVTGERQGFKSQVVPPWCRKSPKVTEVLPLLYFAWHVEWGLRARARRVLRFCRWLVGVGDHPAHDPGGKTSSAASRLGR